MSDTAFEGLVLRVAAARRSRGDLDAAFLDAVAVVLGVDGLQRLVAWLVDEGLPGVLVGLADLVALPDAGRRLSSAVARLADRDAARSCVLQLERARRHLGLLAGLGPAHASDLTAELAQLAADLAAGREVL